MLTTTSAYDEALIRLHHTGPEFEGWLSNHGPMVVEALARRDHEEVIHPWVDDYLTRLDDVPRGINRIDVDAWRDPLGDPTRAGDWLDLFLVEVAEQPWTEVLATWWPRLLPGIAAGATHGVIRTGHAVQALRELETAPRFHELAHALAYWAARWQPVHAPSPTGPLDVTDALGGIPAIADQQAGIRARLAQLPDTPEWASRTARLTGPATAEQVPAALAKLVDAAVIGYGQYGHDQPTMLVHAATAPNAVAMTLPSLPTTAWLDSFTAGWAATSAVVAAYRSPAGARPARDGTAPEAADVEARALAHGGEHVIKFVDTALRAHGRTGDPACLAAAVYAVDLDA